MVIHFARRGEMLGQYPEDGVASLVRAHAISGTDFYWHEGMAEWAPVASSPWWWEANPEAAAAAAASSTPTAPGFAVVGNSAT